MNRAPSSISGSPSGGWRWPPPRAAAGPSSLSGSIKALAAPPRCRWVVAVDVSPAMLAVLRARGRESGLANLECVHDGLLSYDHAGGPADVVHSRHVLHHVPNFLKAVPLRLMASMLRPGGVLSLRDLVFSCTLARGRRDRAVARRREHAARRRLSAPGAGDAPAQRTQHLQLAVGADDRAGGIHHQGSGIQRFPDFHRLHMREARLGDGSAMNFSACRFAIRPVKDGEWQSIPSPTRKKVGPLRRRNMRSPIVDRADAVGAGWHRFRRL